MKIYIATLLLTFLLHSGQSIAGSSHDMPIPTECSYCVTDYQFKNHAKNLAPRNDVNYYLIYSIQNKSIKTIRVVDIFEPQDQWLSFTSASIVNTMQAHSNDFNAYLDFIESGKDEETFEIDYAQLGGAEADGFRAFESIYGSYDSIQMLTLAYLGTSKPFAAGQYEVVTIAFPNGDVAVLAINDGPKDSLLSMAQLPILVVVDKDGKTVFVLTTNGSSVTDQSGTLGEGGYIVFETHTVDGITVCMGACPTNAYTIVITNLQKKTKKAKKSKNSLESI